MQESKKEYLLGLFVIFGLVCLGYLTVKLGRMELFSNSSYTIQAQFTSVSGLRSGASIEIAGVKVGSVGTMTLDPRTSMAIVDLHINKDIELSEDTMASIKTSGLIGDKYIGLSLGGSPDILKAGDIIVDTESSLDIEELISKYVFSSSEK